MGCMFDHIRLDNKYIQHTLPKKGQYALLYYLDFLIVTVYIYIYINKLMLHIINSSNSYKWHRVGHIHLKKWI
jgi:hypothetical protein